jgi:hypothetical protein
MYSPWKLQDSSSDITKVNQEEILQYPEIKGKILIWTFSIQNEGMLFFNIVPLTAEVSVTACDKFVRADRIERMSTPRCVSHVTVARLTSSSQVKRCPDSCSFKARNSWKSLDTKFGLYGRWFKGFQPNFRNRFWDCCVVCGWALSLRGVSPSLRRPGRSLWPQEVYDSLDFQERPVFLLGLHVEVPQLYSFCTFALSHVSVKTRSLCLIYQQHLKFQRIPHLE